MIRRVLAAALVAVALAGCGTTEFVGDPERTAPPAPVDVVKVPDPSAIVIPRIDARSSLIKLGLGADGELVPPPVTEPMQAGWYAGRDPEFDGDEFQPGENGPAVIAGHVDGIVDGRKGQPGIFARLGELGLGDEILIERDGAPTLRFTVSATGSFPKEHFPTEQVYGPTRGPELRLITCGGVFDRATGHYVDNQIVWATLAA